MKITLILGFINAVLIFVCYYNKIRAAAIYLYHKHNRK